MTSRIFLKWRTFQMSCTGCLLLAHAWAVVLQQNIFCILASSVSKIPWLSRNKSVESRSYIMKKQKEAALQNGLRYRSSYHMLMLLSKQMSMKASQNLSEKYSWEDFKCLYAKKRHYRSFIFEPLPNLRLGISKIWKSAGMDIFLPTGWR